MIVVQTKQVKKDIWRATAYFDRDELEEAQDYAQKLRLLFKYVRVMREVYGEQTHAKA